MKFNLVDKIEQLTDDTIVGVKNVSLAEEYLADHFPTFPVLPGVMMLEVAVQSAMWLLHSRSGFGKSMAVLKEARNVKYGNFVAPGNHLRVDQRDVERFRHELVVGVPKSPGLWYPDFFFTLPNIGGNEDLTYIRVVVDRFVVSFRAAEATTEFVEALMLPPVIVT